MNAPQWATQLVQRVADDHGIEAPVLVWRHSRRYYYSSGHYREAQLVQQEGSTYVQIGRGGKERVYEGWAVVGGPRIVVTAGADRADRKATVLHEMSHAIGYTREPKVPGHGPEFYAILGELTLRYGGTLRAIRGREVVNRKAIIAGFRLMRERRRQAA